MEGGTVVLDLLFQGLFLGKQRVHIFQDAQGSWLYLPRLDGLFDLSGNKGTIVDKILFLVLLAQFVQIAFILACNFGKASFFCPQCCHFLVHFNALHQLKGQHMTHPAVLYFGILFQHHVGVYLLGCGKTLGLDDFKVNGDFLPVIVQKLVCCIAVNQRNSCQPCKDLPAQAFFLAGSIQLRHAVDECGLQVGIKVTESILESGLERHHIRVGQNSVL